MSHSHRATLKQSNKPFKGHGMNQKNAPKPKAMQVAALDKDLAKNDRVNMARQLREGKSAEVLNKKLLGNLQPPKTVCFLSFHHSVNTTYVKSLFTKMFMGEEAAATIAPNTATTILLPPWAQPSTRTDLKKQRMTLIDVPTGHFEAGLDFVKIADLVVCCFGRATLEEPAFDEEGYRLLAALQLQGLPSLLGVVAPSATLNISGKVVKENISFAERYFTSELGLDKKFHALENEVDIKNTARLMAAVTPKQVGFRMNRGYLLATDYKVDELGRLIVEGYARGVGFSCRHPVHLTGIGDAILTNIETGADPCPIGRSAGAGELLDAIREDTIEDIEEAWRNLLPFNPLEGEQTHLGRVAANGAEPADEGMDAAMEEVLLEDTRNAGRKKQLEVVGGKKATFTGELDMDMDGNMKGEDEDDEEVDQDEEDDELLKGLLGQDGEVADGFESSGQAAEEKKRVQLLVRAEEELQFPDEKDTPLDQPARERFKKYRGLGSFKTSAWDPYLDLPSAYQRVFEFEAFRATAKAAVKDFVNDCNSVDAAGRFVRLTLEAPGLAEKILNPNREVTWVIVSSLLGIERKVTVQHMKFTRILPFDEPIQSKDVVDIHCGFRRFPARPLYSTIPLKTVGSFETKSRFRRFLNLDGTDHYAQVLAPAVVSPCSALLFKKDIAGIRKHLAAWGSVEQPDPTSVCLKRILLTGYPFRVHKKKTVVRFMFFSAADVKWFKPVQVHTKRGTLGHVIESVGTHGYMKCRFAGKISQADTVCMPLFKRVYPLWHSPSWQDNDNLSVEDAPVATPVRDFLRTEVKPAMGDDGMNGDSWE